MSAVNRVVLEDALNLTGFTDFEDAVLYQSALHGGAQIIVTRHIRDYRKSKLPIYSPDQLLTIMAEN